MRIPKNHPHSGPSLHGGWNSVYSNQRRKFCALTVLCILVLQSPKLSAVVPVDLSGYDPVSGFGVSEEEGRLELRWPMSVSESGALELNLEKGKPLIESVGVQRKGGSVRTIATDLQPITILTVGSRDSEKAERGHGMVFFDNPRSRPHETHLVSLEKVRVRVSNEETRASISVGKVSAGSFQGEMRFTVYLNSPLVHAEAILQTEESHRAILYDAGLGSSEPDWERTVWVDSAERIQKAKTIDDFQGRTIEAKYRTVAVENDSGAIAIFPAPHQYFYPLDFANNFGFNWFGEGFRERSLPYGFGVHQPLEGDRRFVPWFDAPAGTQQRLGVFYLLDSGSAEEAIEVVKRYTRGDRFKELSGYLRFTSHYHIEHTLDYLEKQEEQETSGIPKGLAVPGFVTKFKETGIDIVHLAEFHRGWTPSQEAEDRLPMLQTMHEECARLSDDELLVLPGEEPNVHLGGHWVSFFPRPINWVLNRSADEPFVTTNERFGKVYRVGSREDVLRLMNEEGGLMWTAHPRIKSSLGYPDAYKETEFFRSDRFLGGAWKAMPAELSRDRLGWRVLDLLDDMNQWGERKQVLGEVDVFRVEPEYELYGHMNVNYLRLDELPRFEDGWKPVLEALRGGRYFVTTGEILIPKFTVNGKQSGETVTLSQEGVTMQADLEWTFPLEYAEIVSGDGEEVFRRRIDLSETEGFGAQSIRMPVELADRTWVRFEVWDIAVNGAFTQPVWIE